MRLFEMIKNNISSGPVENPIAKEVQSFNGEKEGLAPAGPELTEQELKTG